jgi:hypothetical protein
MGHTRLGKIPTSKKWKEVVGLLASEAGEEVLSLGDDVPAISSLAIKAAEAGIEKAISDPGLKYTFYLLTQLVLAAREPDWQERLSKHGVRLADDGSIFDLTAEVQDSISSYLSKHGRPTDISEISQQAIGEALSSLAGPRAQSLFGSGADELKIALKELSTKKGFSKLGQAFFGRFMARFLNFYLSRETAARVGQSRLTQIGELTRFNDALLTHCNQSAQIVHTFCGEWYSKTEFKEGISLRNTSGFLAVAMKKLREELRRQGVEQ